MMLMFLGLCAALFGLALFALGMRGAVEDDAAHRPFAGLRRVALGAVLLVAASVLLMLGYSA
jgi:hypothetical protein